MICQRCAIRLCAARPVRTLTSPVRSVSSVAQAASQPSRGPPSGSHEGPPAATSTSAAQPFSSGTTPGGVVRTPAASATEPAAPRSSVPAGTPLKGLGYMKNKDPPMALEDHEYPDWLWGLLDEGEKASKSGGATEGDAYAKSKKQRRIAAKAAARALKNNPDALLPKIPIDHQTIDLPSGNGSVEGALEAGESRKELTQAMRDRRRKGIKEKNFLTGMR